MPSPKKYGAITFLLIWLCLPAFSQIPEIVPVKKIQKQVINPDPEVKNWLAERGYFSGQNSSCMTCHDSYKEGRFSAQKLLGLNRTIAAQIQECLQRPDRIHARLSEISDKKIKRMETYLKNEYQINE